MIIRCENNFLARQIRLVNGEDLGELVMAGVGESVNRDDKPRGELPGGL